jgi:spore coat protein X
MIWVKESCNITVNSTDTQAAVSLQAGLELAISLVVNIAIGSSDDGNAVSQELLQQVRTEQTNRQKVFIYNTKDATVTTTNTDLAINIQALLQVLIALVLMIDVL